MALPGMGMSKAALAIPPRPKPGLDGMERVEGVSIGNPGYQFYGFRLHGHGATVVKMEASDRNPSRAYSKIMKRETAIYMKGKVEHPLYLRGDWR